MKTQLEVSENKQIIKGSQTRLFFSPPGKNFKIEFILDESVLVESRPLRLASQSVSSPGSSTSGSSNSKASTVGTAAQRVTTVISCLVGRVLLLEVFMTAVLTLNVL